MKNMRTKLIRDCVIILVFLGLSVIVTSIQTNIFISHAEQSTARRIQILTLDRDVKAYAEPDDSSEVLREIAAGTAVAVVGEEDGYTVITYQDHDEYIKNEDITSEAKASSEASAKEIAELLDEEFDQLSKEDEAYIESLEKQRIKSRNAIIWKIVIAVLVVLLFTVSIIAGVKNSHKEKT